MSYICHHYIHCFYPKLEVIFVNHRMQREPFYFNARKIIGNTSETMSLCNFFPLLLQLFREEKK